jgi:flagellar basal-body rod protein FlgC
MSSALSGMRAASRMLDASAHNTANLNTDGYKRLKAIPEDVSDGVVVNISTDNSAGRKYRDPEGNIIESSNVDYAEEAVAQITAKHYFSANAAAFRTAAEMSGSLVDLFA